VTSHLWQSTLFALAAALLTVWLQRSRAQLRYSIWFIASVKFLIPFSILIGIGSHLGISPRISRPAPGLSYIVQRVNQPFTLAVSPSPADSGLRSILPALLIAVWLCGAVVILLRWWMRWRRIAEAVRTAVPLRHVREVAVLSRLQSRLRIRSHIQLVSSSALLEPGVFGIRRPIVTMPAGIADRLADAELESVIAHELCHVRRQDNLASVIHMIVESVFWFHPLVWWLGARLLEERERACDEEVLRSGAEPQIYAGSILKVCQFYLESPLACVSGVTGSNLKNRMERIMNNRMGNKLSLTRRILLASLGAAAALGPIAIGVMTPQSRAAQSSPGITGVWTGIGTQTGALSGAGQKRPVQLNLEQKGSEVTGLIGSPQGQLPILSGRIEGDKLSFEVSSQPVPIKFELRLMGGRIRGSARSDTFEMELEVRRARAASLDDLAGTWAGAFTMIGLSGPQRHPPALLHLRQNGNDITGSMGLDDDHQAPILNGRIEGDTIRFEQDTNELRVKLELRLKNGWLKGSITGADHGNPISAELEVARFTD
jgi:beta-lactamase regulating signal transducer with metallopeptidase domain